MSQPQDKQEILDLAERYVCPDRVRMLSMFGAPPVMGERGGHFFKDLDGRELFDVHINGGTFNLGHRHPEVVAALHEAADLYDVGNHHFPSGPRARLAEALVETAPGDLRYAVFTPCGSEANDVAIKTARRVTGRRKILSIVGSYYGHTGLALAAGDVENARYFHCDGPEADFEQVPFNDLEAMKRALSRKDVAAVILETIPATLGFPLPAPGYLPGIKSLCEQFGSLYVADEVQTGLGRTGSFWAIETYGVEPDMLVTGKGLSGGMYPMAATLLSGRVAGWLSDNGWGHVSTFGGSEIGCHVALKVVEIINRPGVLENVRVVSEKIRGALEGLKANHPFLVEIRQNGLVMGLCFDDPLGGMLMTMAGYECGLWAFFAGFDRSVLQFKPDITVTPDEVPDLMSRLEKSIELASKNATEASGPS